ncbi:MAG: hypothetical protein JNK64_17700 [Myxococcales bacterium]|nr:hypothetical protein [Myxococcales bacterium]
MLSLARALLVLVLGACATHDARHARSLAARAACGDDGLAVFGFPRHETQCTDDVAALGDGCYAVVTPSATALVECVAAAPDGHVMCLQDPRPRPALFAGDPVRIETWVWQRGQPAIAKVAMGRCRPRFAAWTARHEAPVPAPELAISDWYSPTGWALPPAPAIRFTPPIDRGALQALMPAGALEIEVCPVAAPPGIAVTRVPVPLAAGLAPAVVDALVRWGRPLQSCRSIVVGFVGAHLT